MVSDQGRVDLQVEERRDEEEREADVATKEEEEEEGEIGIQLGVLGVIIWSVHLAG